LRNLIIALGVFAIAAPAAAQPYPAPAPYPSSADSDLPPPGEIEEMGDRIGDTADAIMDVEIGPVADAIDPSRRYRRYRDRTVGDVASHSDPYARERIRDSIDRTTTGLSVALEQLAILTPVLMRSIEDATRRIEDAARTPRGRYYDRRDDRYYDPRRDDYRR
jgi:hypothetical protein